MGKKYLYINTMGCQMNVYDSEQMANRLEDLGYILTPSAEKADLILVNTCSIREKAENKTYSFLGRLARLKEKKKNLIIGVGGCLAQQEGEKMIEKAPYLDLVFGTQRLSRLAEHVNRISKNRCKIVDVEMPNVIDETSEALKKSTSYEDGRVTSFVTIMQGCDNFCTYCVVPYVRGREVSRHPENIISEIEELVHNGVKEVTLLGQNVNSYGKKEGLCSYSDLLKKINDIKGLYRIRFTTSHPKDLSSDLINAFRYLPKLANHIHLPVQSGSNKILNLMNRKYTREEYFEKVDKLKSVCSDISFSSDIIVGFPGETISDFNDTIDLVKKVEFDSIFAFKYSDRPNALSVNLPDKIPDKEKGERLKILLDIQTDITTKRNEELIGKIVEVLVEGFSKRKSTNDSADNSIQWTGRTSTNKIVHFAVLDNNESFKGKLVKIIIDRAYTHSLFGKITG